MRAGSELYPRGVMMLASVHNHYLGCLVQVAGLFELVVERWLSTNGLEEAPTKSWLLSYMEEAESGVYQASNEGDRVWAVYTYFCW